MNSEHIMRHWALAEPAGPHRVEKAALNALSDEAVLTLRGHRLVNRRHASVGGQLGMFEQLARLQAQLSLASFDAAQEH